MALNDTMQAAANKKEELLDNEPGRFFVRSILGGIYLMVGTAFAAVVGNMTEQLFPGSGAVVFAMLFGLGLFAIIVLAAELATGDMMFSSWAATVRQFSWGKGIWIVVVATVGNLVGALLIAWILSQSAKFGSLDNTHLISTLVEGKLNKDPWGTFVEAMLANFVVNMAIVGALLSKEVISKFIVILPTIAIFVGLGLEHVIANFCLMGMALFADPQPDGFTFGAVALNWGIVWVGNFIGGGLGIGAVYAWLNKTNTVYKD